MAVRSSHAEWQGNLRDGNGSMKLGSGMFEGPFTFASRFENGKGTNPEELIGAAHAGCFSMFLAALLSGDGYVPNSVKTTASVHLGDGPTINKIELVCVADVPNIDAETFADYAVRAKEGCPVSKALAAVPEVVLDASLA